MHHPNWTDLRAAAEAVLAEHEGEGPGLTILGFDREGTRFALSKGYADLNHRTPFGPETVVRLASNTKHIFWTMLLCHPELIRPEDRLGSLLDGLDPEMAQVTVHQALTMTGGLPDTRECLALHSVGAQIPLGEAETIAYSKSMAGLNYPAGAEITYTNTGYRLVEWALRDKGLNFDDFVAREIRQALGVPLYAPRFWGEVVPGLVPGYWRAPEGWTPGAQGMPLGAAGNIAGSALALAHWVRALHAGQGCLAGIWDRLVVSGETASGEKTGYGLGIYQIDVEGRRYLGHSGSQPGYKSQFLLDAETGAGIVLTSNRDDVAVTTLAKRVLSGRVEASLPRPHLLKDGYYVAAEGPRWLRIEGSTVWHMGAGDVLHGTADGAAQSLSPTSPLNLRPDGDDLVGHVGFNPVRFRPADLADDADLSVLQGDWVAEAGGARLRIEDHAIVQGIGPDRRHMPLMALGGGRYLFTRTEAPWPAQICLVRESADRISLATGRARRVVYLRD